jgi:hypothetical protein
LHQRAVPPQGQPRTVLGKKEAYEIIMESIVSYQQKFGK